MKIYFACEGAQDLEKQTGYDFPEIQNVLVSYHRINNIKKIQGLEKRKSFLDSGAFSAHTRGAKIDIDAYIHFIEQTKSLWVAYAGLDVIGDFIATQRNQEYMESKGLTPIPTFHYLSPIERLDELLKKYPYIALGGLVQISTRKKEMEQWLDYCFSRIVKVSPLPKIHGFGVNSLWALKKYPFYSVDATSWKQGGIHGRVVELKGFQTVARDKKTLKGKAYYFNGQHYRVGNKKNVEVLLKLEKMLTELWAKRGITFNE